MIAEFYKVLLTLYYISHLSCQRQLTTKWKLGLNSSPLRFSKDHLLSIQIKGGNLNYTNFIYTG
jgi:hypothetical protein